MDLPLAIRIRIQKEEESRIPTRQGIRLPIPDQYERHRPVPSDDIEIDETVVDFDISDHGTYCFWN